MATAQGTEFDMCRRRGPNLFELFRISVIAAARLADVTLTVFGLPSASLHAINPRMAHREPSIVS